MRGSISLIAVIAYCCCFDAAGGWHNKPSVGVLRCCCREYDSFDSIRSARHSIFPCRTHAELLRKMSEWVVNPRFLRTSSSEEHRPNSTNATTSPLHTRCTCWPWWFRLQLPWLAAALPMLQFSNKDAPWQVDMPLPQNGRVLTRSSEDTSHKITNVSHK